MKPIWKYVICWTIAVIVTLVAASYQRMTGPTYEKKIKVELNGKQFKFKFPRTCDTSKNCEIKLPVGNEPVTANLYYKRFKTNDVWDTVVMQKHDDCLVGELPKQPMAGKLQYFVELNDGKKTQRLDNENQVVIRFKGDVPGFVLWPHVFFIFLAMLLSNLSGLIAAFRLKKMQFYSLLTLIILFIGGMILGPVMQKYAFGEFWTGAPFGWDLTDNKTLIAFIAWIIAVAANWKKPRPVWIILAALVTLIIFSIPHSMFGSELNYTSGTVTTG
jgi:hypothetical protein